MPLLINLLDDATRPKAPPIAGVTPMQRRRGQRLAMIHEMHLQQMDEVRSVLDAVMAGEKQAEALGTAVAGMEMAHNYRVFGSLCGQECSALTFHHTAEDEQIFPPLMVGSDGLRRVVERLSAEHLVIHELLEHFEDRVLAIMANPGTSTFADLREVFDVLEKVVRSHFGYEQAELEEALGTMDVPF